jgi:CyaY protein
VDDREFLLRADEALQDLNRRLAVASNDFPLESDLSSGALVIEFEDAPVKFVVSPNSPVRQIWLSALSKSFKLDWNPERKQFVLTSTGQSLADLISACLSEQLEETVKI